MIDLDKIAARAGSLRGKHGAGVVSSVLYTVLFVDLPALLTEVRAARRWLRATRNKAHAAGCAAQLAESETKAYKAYRDLVDGKAEP